MGGILTEIVDGVVDEYSKSLSSTVGNAISVYARGSIALPQIVVARLVTTYHGIAAFCFVKAGASALTWTPFPREWL